MSYEKQNILMCYLLLRKNTSGTKICYKGFTIASPQAALQQHRLKTSLSGLTRYQQDAKLLYFLGFGLLFALKVFLI